LAETEWNLAQIDVYDWKPHAALKHGQRALALARELALKELIARSLNVLALAYSDLGQWRQMEVHAQEAATLYVGLGNQAMEADCLSLIANARVNYGQTRPGIEVDWQALAIVQEIENSWGQVITTIHLSEGLIEAGLYSEAIILAGQAATLARTHHPILAPYILSRLGTAQQAVLALESVCTTHLEALAINQALPFQPFTEMIHVDLCADYALSGDWQAASAHAQQALAVRNYDLLYLGLTRWYETEALLRAGEVELARTDLHRFGALIKDHERGDHNPRLRIPYLRCLTVLAEWEGNQPQAIDHLTIAADLSAEMALPGSSGRSWRY
jgi:tetratricopeptide (TPR) repeat protein